jgi:predicted permease
MFHRLFSFLKTLTRGGRFSQDLDDEMAFHIELLTGDLIRSGMDPVEARREALLRFGSTERAKSRSREVRGVAFLDELGRNLKFAFRGMARRPLLTGTFLLTLGLCVGASTAVFSVVDSILWRALPYPDPDNLALAVVYHPETGIRADMSAVTGMDWERVRDGAGPLNAAVFSDWPSGVNLSADAGAAFVQQQRVGEGYFRTLGVPPFMGREFDVSEDTPGGPPAAILSHGLWSRTFQQDPDILGRRIRLKGEEHTVVGVMPASFQSHLDADVWTPLQASNTGEGGGANYQVLIRIPGGVPWEEANARVGAIDANLTEDGEASDRRYGLVPLDSALTATIRTPLLLLLSAVVLMLLVGCANLAGLQVARAMARRPEIATRQAVGGGAGSLFRQILTENLVLGLVGGCAGLIIGYLALGGLAEVVSTQFDTWQAFSMDVRAVTASVVVTAAAVVLFGLAPLLQVRRLDLRSVLVSGYRGAVSGGSHRLRRTLLVVQVGLVTALLFSAGLLVRSYGHLEGLDPGFDPEGVLTVQLSLDDARFSTGEDVMVLFQETLSEIETLPQVRSAAVALTLPYERPLNFPFAVLDAPDEGPPTVTSAVYVTPAFVETLGLPILGGRNLEEADGTDATPVVLANQAFVDQYLGEVPPVGARLGLGGNSEVVIVGVVGNVQQASGGWGSGGPVWASPTLYIPAAQAGGPFMRTVHTWFTPSWLVKGRGDPAQWSQEVARAINVVNPDLPLARIASLEEVVSQALARQRLGAAFLIMVAGFALILALVGLYGIIANEVVERKKEMGLRMALGATPGGTVRTVGMSGLRLVVYGLLVGAALAVGISRVIVTVIWGVTPFDPPTIAMGLVCMLALGGAASFVPAARVGRMDHARVLREE